MTITTTYQGPTDYTGSRIIARGNGRQFTWSYDYALSPTDNHAVAASGLASRIDSAAMVHRLGESRTGRGYRYTI